MNTMETVKNVAYENGTRISTVERVVTRADDAEQLGNLYRRSGTRRAGGGQSGDPCGDRNVCWLSERVRGLRRVLCRT